MIHVRILDTKNLIGAERSAIIDSLPFGQDERDRLASFGESTRQLESLGALIALCDIVSKGGALDSAEITRDSAKNGKPYFKNSALPRFSLAHSCGICAAATTSVEIGIDIELIRHFPRKEELVKRFFNDDEKLLFSQNPTDENFLLLWTQKEARIKMRGAALATSLKCAYSNQEYIFSDVITVGGHRLALTVCAGNQSEITIDLAN